MTGNRVFQALARADFETRRKSERHTALRLYERSSTEMEDLTAACQHLPKSLRHGPE